MYTRVLSSKKRMVCIVSALRSTANFASIHVTLRSISASHSDRTRRNINTMRVETDGQSSTITVHPHEGKHSASIILMHGLGDSADGFLDVAQTLNKSMPFVKFLIPTAGKRSVTISGGMAMNAWYDITGLTDRSAEDCDGIEASVAVVRSLIQSEITLGIPSNRIVLAGFSQGGAMSLFTGLQLPIEMKPGGVLVMSGYLPGASKFKITPGLEDVPVLHCHGTADPVVIYDHAEKTRKHVTDKGLKSYAVRPFQDIGHTVCPDIMRTAVEFLLKTLPDMPELALKPKAPIEMTVRELKEAIRRAGLSGKSVGFYEKREFVQLLEEYHSTL